MKRFLALFSVALLLTLIATPAHAQTRPSRLWYVAPLTSGLPNGDGKTPQTPMLSICNVGRRMLAGDTMVLLAGVYTEAIENRCMPEGVEGVTTMITDYQLDFGRAILVPPDADDHGIFLSQRSYLHFYGFVIDARNSGYEGIKFTENARHNTVERVEVYGAAQSCIHIGQGADYTHVTDSYLHDCGRLETDHGIYVQAHYAQIVDNRIEYITGGGVQVRRASEDGGILAGAVLQGNHIRYTVRGLTIYGALNPVITENVITDVRSGISVSLGTTGGVFTDNIIQDAFVGVGITVAQGNTFTDNIIVQSQRSGVQINPDAGLNTITGNVFVDNFAVFDLRADQPVRDGYFDNVFSDNDNFVINGNDL